MYFAHTQTEKHATLWCNASRRTPLLCEAVHFSPAWVCEVPHTLQASAVHKRLIQTTRMRLITGGRR